MNRAFPTGARFHPEQGVGEGELTITLTGESGGNAKVVVYGEMDALHRIEACLIQANESIGAAIAAKNGAYTERNQVVAALAKCFPSGTRDHDIEGEALGAWRVVYIDLPTGQVSWHYPASEGHLFSALPPYTADYDGHSTKEKYRRLAEFKAGAWVACDFASGPDWTTVFAVKPSAAWPPAPRRTIWRSDLAVALFCGFRWYRRFYGGRWERHYFGEIDVRMWLNVAPGMEWPHHVPAGSRGTPVVEEYRVRSSQ